MDVQSISTIKSDFREEEALTKPSNVAHCFLLAKKTQFCLGVEARRSAKQRPVNLA